jgi:hypothetical protein
MSVRHPLILIPVALLSLALLVLVRARAAIPLRADPMCRPDSRRIPREAPAADSTILPSEDGVDSRPSAASPDPAPARKEIEALYYQVLATVRIRGRLTPDEYGQRLARLSGELARLLAGRTLPLLLGMIRETPDAELGACMLQSLLSIHDGGDEGDALNHLCGRATGLVRPLDRDVSAALLAIAASPAVAESLRILIYEELASRLSYDAEIFARLRGAAERETSETARGRAFQALAQCRGIPKTEDGGGIYPMARTLLTRGSDAVRVSAASLLERDGTAVESLATAAAGDPSAEVRREALRSLIGLGLSAPLDPDGRERIARSLSAAVLDPDPRVAGTAVDEAGRLVTALAAPELSRNLDRVLAAARSTSLRESAVESLYQMAASGFCREEIRARLRQSAADDALPPTLRARAASRAAALP